MPLRMYEFGSFEFASAVTFRIHGVQPGNQIYSFILFDAVLSFIFIVSLDKKI